MEQNISQSSEVITCENITGETIAAYAKRGFSLIFSEVIMRYDLAHTLPDIIHPLPVSYLTWNPQNIPTFFQVYCAAFRERPGFPGWDEATWAHWIASDPSFRPDLSFLAIVQEQAVGFVTNAEDEINPEQNGYLIQVGVHPRWRRQKLGAALVSHSLRQWREMGKRAVILHVNDNNPQAILLYQQLGFATIGRRGKFCLHANTEEEHQ